MLLDGCCFACFCCLCDCDCFPSLSKHWSSECCGCDTITVKHRTAGDSHHHLDPATICTADILTFAVICWWKIIHVFNEEFTTPSIFELQQYNFMTLLIFPFSTCSQEMYLAEIIILKSMLQSQHCENFAVLKSWVNILSGCMVKVSLCKSYRWIFTHRFVMLKFLFKSMGEFMGEFSPMMYGKKWL